MAKPIDEKRFSGGSKYQGAITGWNADIEIWVLNAHRIANAAAPWQGYLIIMSVDFWEKAEQTGKNITYVEYSFSLSNLRTANPFFYFCLPKSLTCPAYLSPCSTIKQGQRSWIRKRRGPECSNKDTEDSNNLTGRTSLMKQGTGDLNNRTGRRKLKSLNRARLK